MTNRDLKKRSKKGVICKNRIYEKINEYIQTPKSNTSLAHINLKKQNGCT